MACLHDSERSCWFWEQMGDTNPRTQSAAHDAVVRMAQVKQLNMSNQMPLVLKPQKNQSAWRPVLGRLKLLAAVIPLLGIAKAGGDGVPGGRPLFGCFAWRVLPMSGHASLQGECS